MISPEVSTSPNFWDSPLLNWERKIAELRSIKSGVLLTWIDLYECYKLRAKSPCTSWRKWPRNCEKIWLKMRLIMFSARLILTKTVSWLQMTSTTSWLTKFIGTNDSRSSIYQLYYYKGYPTNQTPSIQLSHLQSSFLPSIQLYDLQTNCPHNSYPQFTVFITFIFIQLLSNI